MKTIFQNVIILSFVACAFGACKKKDSYKAYSFNGLSLVTSGGDLFFNGAASGGSSTVIDCGVILSSNSGATIDNASQKVSLGEINTNANNAFFVSFKHLNLNSPYYAKGYIKDVNGYTYSNELLANTACLAVDSINQTTINNGTNFVIFGKNFGTVSSNINVRFINGSGSVYQNSIPTSVANSAINVNIPAGFSSGDKITFHVQRTDNSCPYTYYSDDRFVLIYQ